MLVGRVTIAISAVAVVALTGCGGDPSTLDGGQTRLPTAAPEESPRQAAARPAAVDPVSGLAVEFDDFVVTGADPGLEALTVVAGVDISPGTYRTDPLTIEPDGSRGLLFDHSCVWGLREGGSSGFEGVLSVGENDAGRPTMTIAEGQEFSSKRCGRWSRVDEDALFTAPDAAPTEIGDGIWLVGEDLAPGRWRAHSYGNPDDPDAWCAWEIDSHWRDWEAEILDMRIANKDDLETVIETGQQFRSDGCGGWTRIGDAAPGEGAGGVAVASPPPAG
ncbi:hypothetical protein [Demequina sediminis]|nr:hypothetical protein [Demequina sediminis]BDZ62088.1 hypothetical protein GCM10025873_18790 [Demequina sediminis]